MERCETNLPIPILFRFCYTRLFSSVNGLANLFFILYSQLFLPTFKSIQSGCLISIETILREPCSCLKPIHLLMYRKINRDGNKSYLLTLTFVATMFVNLPPIKPNIHKVKKKSIYSTIGQQWLNVQLRITVNRMGYYFLCRS